MSSYSKPKHVTNNFNPLDFPDKDTSQETGYVKMTVPATDSGVVYYKTSNKSLNTDANLVYKSASSSLGIGTNNPLTKLSITPVDGNSSKITLYDKGLIY